MPHMICEPCIGVKDRACVDVCPVECIHPIESEDRGEVQLFIHPDECIDCGACVPVCPVEAIFTEDNIPKFLAWVYRKEQRLLRAQLGSISRRMGCWWETSPMIGNCF
jgi:ferredoxin